MIYPYMAIYYNNSCFRGNMMWPFLDTQAVLGAEETSYDQYKAFKLFESFPEVGIRSNTPNSTYLTYSEPEWLNYLFQNT